MPSAFYRTAQQCIYRLQGCHELEYVYVNFFYFRNSITYTVSCVPWYIDTYCCVVLALDLPTYLASLAIRKPRENTIGMNQFVFSCQLVTLVKSS